MTLRRIVFAALPSILVGLASAPASASGDQCDPGWSLDFARRPLCANIPALVPGNDTRANLLLLLADRHNAPASALPAPRPVLAWEDFRTFFGGPAASDGGTYAMGEGSRCRSDAAGQKAFAAAVQADTGLSADERKALTDARTSLLPTCAGDAKAAGSPPPADGSPPPAPAATAAPPAGVSSAEGRAFAAYLTAAAAFYDGRFGEATKGFEGLRSDSDPWLADTAAYMVARTAVNAIQVGAFDEFGTPKGSTAIDQAAAHRTATSLDAYIKDHPQGLYVVSARGLQRRVAWLAGWTEDLANRYAALIAEPPATRGMDDVALASEIDSKLLPNLTPAMTKDPILLATLDLRAMRKAQTGDAPALPLDLAGQHDAFAATPALYGFLTATAAFYDAGTPKTVIETVPDDTKRRGGDHLWFSRQFLRGLALEAAGDRNARGFWKELLPGAARPLDEATAELALALDDQRRGDMDDAFAPGSPLKNQDIRTILLANDAGPDVLRARAAETTAPPRERQVALYTLLDKDLSYGLYGAFLSDVAAIPSDAPSERTAEPHPLDKDAWPLGIFVRGKTAGEIGCPALSATVTHLARNPRGNRDRLCLGEWIRLNDFDPDPNAVELTKSDLGFGPSASQGTPVARLALYRAVIADRAAAADDRAYALYRAVRCYEPSGNNRCGGKDAVKTERHRWFDTLKQDYPRSRWAKDLHLWW